MDPTLYDTAIVGAGAAGLMTAIQCARHSLKVLLLDSRAKIGAKILMSGGTRCNVTNETVTDRDFASDRLTKVRHILRAYPSDHAVRFFKEIGVDLILEAGGKYFPSTHSAKTVLEALMRECERAGVRLVSNCKVDDIGFEQEHFKIKAGTNFFSAKACVLATGGLSYPGTGSDGSGYELAKSFGHTIVPTLPALTPLKTGDAKWKQLTGISLSVRLSLYKNRKRETEIEGPLLFTHFGFSGPAALDLSRHWLRAGKKSTSIQVCFSPHFSESSFLKLLEEARKNSPQKHIKTILQESLPARFVKAVLEECEIPQERRIAELRLGERNNLVRFLFTYLLPVSDVWGYQKAEVTAGGISLDEINTASMESKKQRGLYFAGEILDADGRIGGFNFQWAWSTGVIAAQGISKQLKR